MKTIKVICILFLLNGLPLLSQEDLIKNYLGVSVGVVPGVTDMYFDDPLNIWPDRRISPVFNAFYARRLGELFRAGGYLGFERINFTDIAGTNINALNGYNIGLTWLTQYPKTAMSLQLGGFFGFGFLHARTWDTQTGFEYGIIAGPAYEMKKIGIALHVHYGRAWYESSGFPLGVMLYDPKILLKVYYKLADF
jgi:hypothetical protein